MTRPLHKLTNAEIKSYISTISSHIKSFCPSVGSAVARRGGFYRKNDMVSENGTN